MAAAALGRQTGADEQLPRSRYRSGEQTLRAFAPVAAATRFSIIKLEVDDTPVALGAVVDTNGLAITKASELKPGKLTCWLASDAHADAEVIARDESADVALVRVHATGLKPIQWSDEHVHPGQWAITPGIAPTPHAIGVVSTLPRRIRAQRALIGVQFDFSTNVPRIEEVLPGLGAEEAGLKAGDVVTALNGAAVTNREQIVERLRGFRAGETVKVRVQRGTGSFEAQIRMMAPSAEWLAGELDAPSGRDRLVGEVSLRAEGFEQVIEHDTVLHPWLCGGPLVDLDGKAIGLNIARASRVSTYALPTSLVKRIVKDLEAKAQKAASTK
ncbi:MAG TPA: PDZ domain-containing protein [Candidatus Acidoferrum sp.]|nr:PDZ domain-containing protein [Candidatus Acidoferrum sp.]